MFLKPVVSRMRAKRRLASNVLNVHPFQLMKNRRSDGKKRLQYRGVCDLRSNQMRDELLPTVPVDEVREIGAAWRPSSPKSELRRVADLAALDRTMRGRS